MPRTLATQRTLATMPAALWVSGTRAAGTPARRTAVSVSGGPMSSSPSTSVGFKESRPSAESART